MTTNDNASRRGGSAQNNGSRIFLVDVEGTSKSSHSGLMTEFGVVDLETGQWFRGQLWDTAPNPDLPAQPLAVRENPQYTVGYGAHDLKHGFTRSAKNAREVAEAHVEWLTKLADGARITFCSDNPAYDFERVNVFFDQCGLPNPYGWTGRRIGDYYAGLTQQFGNTSRWKGLRDTKHTHLSHEDSMGNREALLKLRAATKELNKLYPNLQADLKRILSEVEL